MPGEGFYRATINQIMYGQQIQNVLHFAGPVEDVNGTGANTLCNEVTTIWVARMRTLQSQSLQYVSVTVHAIDSGQGPTTKPIGQNGQGSADNQLDPCAAYIIRLRTNNPSKHGRGRVYLAGAFNNSYENGIATVAIVNAFGNLFTQIMGNTGFDSSPFKLQVSSRGPDFQMLPVIRLELAPTRGHQRRRNIGIGV